MVVIIFSLVLPSSAQVTGSHIVVENSTLTLNCIVRVYPVPEIVWLKRTEEAFAVILNTTRISITTVYRPSNATAFSSLQVMVVEANDEGEYFCKVNEVIMPTNITFAFRRIRINGKITVMKYSNLTSGQIT